jgi:hypothetical protein
MTEGHHLAWVDKDLKSIVRLYYLISLLAKVKGMQVIQWGKVRYKEGEGANKRGKNQECILIMRSKVKLVKMLLNKLDLHLQETLEPKCKKESKTGKTMY